MEEVPATATATAGEVLALARRLLTDGVELVVVESTDYWRIWFYLLEGAGLNVAGELAAGPAAGRAAED